MSPANPNVAASVRARLLNVAKAQGVDFNQVLVRFVPPSGTLGAEADAFTAAVIRRIQEDGTCWAGGTTWHGMHAMRIAVSNWSTEDEDIDRSADAMLACLHAESLEH